jgi:hypothetical protein
MNNEPVAWIGKDELQFGFTDTRVTNEKESWDDIPLYTHPVKELTDEEIAEVFDNTFKVRDFEDAFLKFARAILRKAQEK